VMLPPYSALLLPHELLYVIPSQSPATLISSFSSSTEKNAFIFPPTPVPPQILPFLFQRQHSFYLSPRSCPSSNPSFPGSKTTFLFTFHPNLSLPKSFPYWLKNKISF